jgi:hypothetical protein
MNECNLVCILSVMYMCGFTVVLVWYIAVPRTTNMVEFAEGTSLVDGTALVQTQRKNSGHMDSLSS